MKWYLPFCVCPCWNILMFFECFYCCLPILMCFFVKIFPHFHDQIKHKRGNRLYSHTKNNKHMESLQTKQTKGLLNLWEVKISGWFTHIGFKRTRFRISCAWYGHSVQKDWSPQPPTTPPPSIDTSLLLIWLPSYFIFFPNPRFLARLFRQWWPFFIFRRDFWQRFFRQYCPFFIFRRLKNNVICFFLQR